MSILMSCLGMMLFLQVVILLLLIKLLPSLTLVSKIPLYTYEKLEEFYPPRKPKKGLL